MFIKILKNKTNISINIKNFYFDIGYCPIENFCLLKVFILEKWGKNFTVFTFQICKFIISIEIFKNS